jgi:hypothetical protein
MIEVITFIVVGWLVLLAGAVVIWLIQTVLE